MGRKMAWPEILGILVDPRWYRTNLSLFSWVSWSHWFSFNVRMVSNRTIWSMCWSWKEVQGIKGANLIALQGRMGEINPHEVSHMVAGNHTELWRESKEIKRLRESKHIWWLLTKVSLAFNSTPDVDMMFSCVCVYAGSYTHLPLPRNSLV